MIEEFQLLNREGSLEERLDPEVGDELDRCAREYAEIGRLLERPEWKDAEGHRLSAKTSVLNAVDALMGDALMIAATGLRSKGMRRDAHAKRLQKPEVRESMMESLARVRNGLRSLRSELGSHPISSQNSLDELELALSKLTEIRLAEEELHQSFRQ
jgi:hypothetical protein